MSLSLGSSLASKVYLGATEIKGAYLGATQVYTSFVSLLDLYPATAAYSAYDLGNKRGSVTESEGTVVNPVQRWRRGSDDALQMFTAAEVADGTALDFVVPTAVQALYSNTMQFDGSTDYVGLGIGDPLGFDGAGKVGATVTIIVPSNPTGTEDIFYNYISGGAVGFALDLQANGTIRCSGRSVGGDGFKSLTSTQTVTLGAINTIQFYLDYANDEIGVKINSNAWETSTATFANATYTNGSSTNSTRIGNAEAVGRFFTGVVKDVEIYKDDVLTNSYAGYGNTSANWEDDTGSVDGTISATSPATFTGQGFDAYLLTEYDQSGNDYDLTQTTAANQPLVVSGGALTVDDYGNVAPSFDGVNDFMTHSATVTQPFTAVSVYTATAVNSPTYGSASLGATLARRSSGEYIMFAGSVLAGGVHPSTAQISSAVFNGASSIGRWDGTQILSGASGTNVNIDLVGSNAGNYHTGNIAATLFYDSDESANLPAIEAKLSTIVTTAIS